MEGTFRPFFSAYFLLTVHMKCCGEKKQSQKKEFFCQICNYRCSRRFLWEQHLRTKKHICQHRQQDDESRENHVCQFCGKSYKCRSGLWRHAKTCKPVTEAPHQSEANAELREMLKELAQSYDASMKSQTDIITQLAAQNIAQNKVIEGLVPRVGNTNNHVNVNVYLDQRCSRAINISDFVASLRIGPSEIAYTCSNGLAQGVTNVLVDGLSRLDTSMRPIQCTDAGQETMYVRENDRWSEDLDQGRIKSAINRVAGLQRQAIADWEAQNPGWKETEDGKQEYLRIVRSLTDDLKKNNSTGKIVSTLARATTLSIGDGSGGPSE